MTFDGFTRYDELGAQMFYRRTGKTHRSRSSKEQEQTAKNAKHLYTLKLQSHGSAMAVNLQKIQGEAELVLRTPLSGTTFVEKHMVEE